MKLRKVFSNHPSRSRCSDAISNSIVVMHYPQIPLHFDVNTNSRSNLDLSLLRAASSSPMLCSNTDSIQHPGELRMLPPEHSSSFVATDSELPVVDISCFNYTSYRHKLIESTLRKQYGGSYPPGKVIFNSIQLNSIDSSASLAPDTSDGQGLFDFVEDVHDACVKCKPEVEYLHPLDHFVIKHRRRASTAEKNTETMETEVDNVWRDCSQDHSSARVKRPHFCGSRSSRSSFDPLSVEGVPTRMKNNVRRISISERSRALGTSSSEDSAVELKIKTRPRNVSGFDARVSRRRRTIVNEEKIPESLAIEDVVEGPEDEATFRGSHVEDRLIDDHDSPHIPKTNSSSDHKKRTFVTNSQHRIPSPRILRRGLRCSPADSDGNDSVDDQRHDVQPEELPPRQEEAPVVRATRRNATRKVFEKSRLPIRRGSSTPPSESRNRSPCTRPRTANILASSSRLKLSVAAKAPEDQNAQNKAGLQTGSPLSRDSAQTSGRSERRSDLIKYINPTSMKAKGSSGSVVGLQYSGLRPHKAKNSGCTTKAGTIGSYAGLADKRRAFPVDKASRSFFDGMQKPQGGTGSEHLRRSHMVPPCANVKSSVEALYPGEGPDRRTSFVPVRQNVKNDGKTVTVANRTLERDRSENCEMKNIEKRHSSLLDRSIDYKQSVRRVEE